MPAANGRATSGPAIRRWPAAGPSRVPNWVYSDPQIFACEQERIFEGPNWLYVCLDAEIPNPGDFTRSRLGTREVVAVRGADGAVNVLLNRCAHRSMQFCSANRGTAKEFICPYHQWTYDLEGRLFGVPFRRGLRGQGGMPEDFRPEDHGLRRLAVASRHGVVFASFAQPNETLEDYFGPRILGWFDRTFDGRELRVLGYQRQRLPGNWKLYIENNRDPYHASLMHAFLVTFGLFRLDQKSATEVDETGRHAALVNQRGEQKGNEATAQMRAFHEGLRLADPRLIDPVREYPGDATVVIQTLWPNLVVQQQSNGLAMRQVVPLDANTFDLVWTHFGYADDPPEMTQRRLRQANLFGPAGYVSVDDGEAMLLSQAGIVADENAECIVEMGGRDTGSVPHTVTETAIRGLYRHYRAVMGL